ncbi:Phosphatidylserine decarboxylase proenzyme, mitochondrial [Hypsibius exemplaris]|uniref:Phosphatidylserine decarboxylase proenzyme, mitochondrial n=1 Tax=Hypsibius exemplaris TaxID=2072580 RepID=A0A1W0WDK3_HYPEX|nr:Phosphatidylserine decarboxylase proenzyme, mitochondrial [Hypsibius exemplaris]
MGGPTINRPLSRFASSSVSPQKTIRHTHNNNVAPGASNYETMPRQFWKPSRWFRGTGTLRKSFQAANRSTQARLSNLFQRRPLVNYSSLRGFATRSGLHRPRVADFDRRNLSKVARGVLKWTPLPLVFGIIFIAYRRMLDKKNGFASVDRPIKRLPWHIPTVFYFYQFLPLRAVSRSWGWLNDVYLPHWLRRPVLSTYIRMFGCDLSEAAVQDLKWYKNLGDFFKRKLRPGVRPIAAGSSVVSPSDGVVLHVGRVEDDCVEQVKGMTYSLAAFLGPKNWSDYTEEDEPIVAENTAPDASTDYRSKLSQQKEGTDLFHCVIYLAPGDYHRFHSPTNWSVHFRRHFPGHLFSVSPSVTRRIEGLFNYNERVVYYGNWKHGFFSMAAVGATNVGSIRVYFDERLKTNNKRYKKGVYQDWNFAQHKAPSDVKGIGLEKGEDFGEFNLGSTIVLLFEAPRDFKFNVEVGDHILYGKALGSAF